MILYFSSNGQLLEYVNEYSLRNPTTDEEIAHGFISASGSVNVNALYAYFEGETPTSSQASVAYLMPNGEIYQNASIPADGTLEAYIKFDKNRDLTNFKAGKSYHFVKFALGSLFAVGGAGNYVSNFELYKNTTEARAFGTFEFTAQGSPSQLIKNEITETQYQLILAQISNYLPITGGAINGDLTINGNLEADSLSFDEVEVESLVSTSIKVEDEDKTYIETSNGELKLKELATPTENGDAANKAYVDSGLEGKADASDLNGKLDKYAGALATPNVVYAKDEDGEKVLNVNKNTYSENYLAMYGQGGTLLTGTPTANNHSATKKYVDDGLAGKADASDLNDKVDKYDGELTSGNVVYGQNGAGETHYFVNKLTYSENFIAQYDAGGTLRAGTPTANYHAATKNYVDSADDELSTRISALEGRGKYLSGYDCSTGIATTNPPSATLVGGVYPYTAGDFFIVAEAGNLIPSGSSYNPSNPQSQTHTGQISVNDTIYYDGTNWSVIHTQTPTISIATTSSIGAVKASTANGKVSVDASGVMSVNGWDSKADSTDLNGKVDKYDGELTSGEMIYGQGSQGEKAFFTNPYTYSNGFIAQYGSNGTLSVGTPTSNQHASTKKYVDDNLGGKLDKYTGTYPTPSAVYAQDDNGEKMISVSKITWSENYIPQYGSGGTLLTGTPTANNHASTKKYVDDGLSGKLDASKQAVANVGGLVIPNSAPITQKIVTIETNGSQGLADFPEGGGMKLVESLPIASKSLYNQANLYLLGNDVYYVTRTPVAEPTVSNLGTMGSTLYDSSATAVMDKIYIFGGADFYNFKNTIYKFDTTNNSLTLLDTTMPSLISGIASAAVGTDIYLIGGSTSLYGSSSIYKFDTTNNSLTLLNLTLPNGICYAKAISVGSKIYVFGGIRNRSTQEIDGWLYVIDTTTLTRHSVIMASRRNVSAAAVGTDIYIFGGYSSYNNNSNTDTILKFDTLTETFTTLTTTLPYKLNSSVASAVGTDIYILGGDKRSDSSSDETKNILKFSTSSQTITTLTTKLSSVNIQTSSAIVGTDIYMFGGLRTNNIYDVSFGFNYSFSKLAIAQGA